MKKVFVAGATGVLGRRVVAELVAAGVEVTGVARRSAKHADLVALGARAVELDLFDRAAVHGAVAGHDVVCNLATAIPVGRAGEPPVGLGGQRPDPPRRVPQPGGRRARGRGEPLRAGVDRLRVRRRRRSVPGRVCGGRGHRVTSAALVAEAEAARFAEHGSTGVALRFGQFYGFDSGHTVQAIEAALAGRRWSWAGVGLPLVGHDRRRGVGRGGRAGRPERRLQRRRRPAAPPGRVRRCAGRRARRAIADRAVGDRRSCRQRLGDAAVAACLEPAVQGGHRVAAAVPERWEGWAAVIAEWRTHAPEPAWP